MAPFAWNLPTLWCAIMVVLLPIFLMTILGFGGPPVLLDIDFFCGLFDIILYLVTPCFLLEELISILCAPCVVNMLKPLSIFFGIVFLAKNIWDRCNTPPKFSCHFDSVLWVKNCAFSQHESFTPSLIFYLEQFSFLLFGVFGYLETKKSLIMPLLFLVWLSPLHKISLLNSSFLWDPLLTPITNLSPLFLSIGSLPLLVLCILTLSPLFCLRAFWVTCLTLLHTAVKVLAKFS